MNRKALILLGTMAFAGCDNELPDRTVTEFMDDPLLLEAALVRCTQNRAETRFSAECVNAREAVKIIEARQEAERRAELEAQSQRKRDALRRTQQAAAEARRRVAEAEKKRREQEYFELYGVMPTDDDSEAAAGNVPMAVIPEATGEDGGNAEPYIENRAEDYASDFVEPPPPAGNNAPVVEVPPAETPAAEDEAVADLESIREELRRRNENDGSN